MTALSIVELERRLQSLPKPPASGSELFFRGVAFRYAKGAPANVLTGAYAGIAGGRFNPPGSHPVCYLAGTQTGASFELEQEALLLGLARPSAPPPRLFVGISVCGGRWLDLTNPMVCVQVGMKKDPEGLFMPSPVWKQINAQGAVAPTQALGAAARNVGFDGIRFPAILEQYVGQTLPGLYNLAIFMDPSTPSQPVNRAVTMTLLDDGLLAP